MKLKGKAISILVVGKPELKNILSLAQKIAGYFSILSDLQVIKFEIH